MSDTHERLPVDDLRAWQARAHIAEQQRDTLVRLVRETASKLTEWADRVEGEVAALAMRDDPGGK